MNAPPLSEFRTDPASSLTDEKMDQIRDLLLGDALRRIEARLNHLDTRLQAVEIMLLRKVEALESRVEAAAGATEGDRRATFEALSQAVSDLGEQIRRISRG